MSAATRVLRRFLAKGDPWPEVAREVAELEKMYEPILALKEPLSKADDEALKTFVWLVMPGSKVLNKWLKDAFMPGEVPDLQRLIPKDSDDLATSLQKIGQHREAIADVMQMVAPSRFHHRKLEIRNPQHCSVGIISKTLGALDAVLDRFQQRKAEPVLLKGLRYLEVLVEGVDATSGWAAGWFDPQTRGITLMARKIQAQAPNHLYDFVLSTTAHELGHLIENTYLSREAVAFWNSEWAEVEAKEAEIDISSRDRSRFFEVWSKYDYDVAKTYAALERGSQFDALRFSVWMLVTKVADESNRLTSKGKRILELLAGDDSKINEALRELRMFSSKVLKVPQRYLSYVLESRPDIPKAIEQAKRNIDTVSDYGRTDKDEDFAETFRAWILSPNTLTDKAKYRMQRTLSLSHLYGKPVMRLAGSSPQAAQGPAGSRSV